MNVIECENLQKEFEGDGTKTVAVNNINLSINNVERAKEVLKQFGLFDKMNALPPQLSGGQQQRVAIARAIVHKPSWLLVDEYIIKMKDDNVLSDKIEATI